MAEAHALVAEAHAARKFTDTAGFTLRCLVCQRGLVGEAGASAAGLGDGGGGGGSGDETAPASAPAGAPADAPATAAPAPAPAADESANAPPAPPPPVMPSGPYIKLEAGERQEHLALWARRLAAAHRRRLDARLARGERRGDAAREDGGHGAADGRRRRQQSFQGRFLAEGRRPVQGRVPTKGRGVGQARYWS